MFDIFDYNFFSCVQASPFHPVAKRYDGSRVTKSKTQSVLMRVGEKTAPEKFMYGANALQRSKT